MTLQTGNVVFVGKAHPTTPVTFINRAQVTMVNAGIAFPKNHSGASKVMLIHKSQVNILHKGIVFLSRAISSTKATAAKAFSWS